MKEYIKVTRYGKIILSILGLLHSLFWGLCVVYTIGKSGIDVVALIIFLIFLPGVWLLMWAWNPYAKLRLTDGQITVRNIWGKKQQISILEIDAYRIANGKMHLYSSDKSEVIEISMRCMKNKKLLLKEISERKDFEERPWFNQIKERMLEPGRNTTIGAVVTISMIALVPVLIFWAEGMVVFGPIMFCACIFLIAWGMWYWKTHYWIWEDDEVIYQKGKEQICYPDSEIEKIIWKGITEGRVRICYYKVAWKNRKPVVFVKSPAFLKWIEKNGFTEEQIQQETQKQIERKALDEQQEMTERYRCNSKELIKRVRILSWIIGVLSVVLLFVANACISDKRSFYGIYVWIPLINLILPLIFPRLIGVERPHLSEKDYWKNHIIAPLIWFGISTMFLVVWIPRIDILSTERATILGVILYLIQITIVLVGTLPRKGNWEFVFLSCVILIIGTMMETQSLIAAFSNEIPTYEEVVVEEKYISRNRSLQYKIVLERENGENFQSVLSRSHYNTVNVGDRAWICKKKVLQILNIGIEFYIGKRSRKRCHCKLSPTPAYDKRKNTGEPWHLQL